VPLVVFLSIPSGSGPDPLAQQNTRVVPGLVAGGVTLQTQQAMLTALLPLLIAKQSVQAVVWNHWRDDAPHEFPHCGLCDAKGKPKPALQALASLRKDLLG